MPLVVPRRQGLCFAAAAAVAAAAAAEVEGSCWKKKPRLGSQLERFDGFLGTDRLRLLTHSTDPPVAVLTSRPSRATHVEKPTGACPRSVMMLRTRFFALVECEVTSVRRS